jgi:Na+/melibiose symporter-like transporter
MPAQMYKLWTSNHVILENVSFYYYYFHYFSVIITYIHSVVNLMQETDKTYVTDKYNRVSVLTDKTYVTDKGPKM